MWRDPVQEFPSTAPWSLHGEQARLVEAARTLRSGAALEVCRSYPLDEYVMFGVARLLDAIAHSLRVGDDVHHTVVSGAMEIADHVLTYVLPTVRQNGHRNEPERNAGP
jgi:hypothetical protein